MTHRQFNEQSVNKGDFWPNKEIDINETKMDRIKSPSDKQSENGENI